MSDLVILAVIASAIAVNTALGMALGWWWRSAQNNAEQADDSRRQRREGLLQSSLEALQREVAVHSARIEEAGQRIAALPPQPQQAMRDLVEQLMLIDRQMQKDLSALSGQLRRELAQLDSSESTSEAFLTPEQIDELIAARDAAKGSGDPSRFVQIVAPAEGEDPPPPEACHTVKIEEITPHGASYLCKEPVVGNRLVIGLGVPPGVHYFTAQVESSKNASWGSDALYHVNCRFTGRAGAGKQATTKQASVAAR